MQIHKFKAASMQEALGLVREALGPDAALLESRPVQGRGRKSRGIRYIEVSATTDADVPSRLPAIVQQSALPSKAAEDNGLDLSQLPVT